ncbi:Protein of unknown function [Gryllus bimaculatus]|nr:Protein of unknown function [Gryllus bimaculatus]
MDTAVLRAGRKTRSENVQGVARPFKAYSSSPSRRQLRVRAAPGRAAVGRAAAARPLAPRGRRGRPGRWARGEGAQAPSTPAEGGGRPIYGAEADPQQKTDDDDDDDDDG